MALDPRPGEIARQFSEVNLFRSFRLSARPQDRRAGFNRPQYGRAKAHPTIPFFIFMIEVREINQIEALGEFRPAWQALLAQTPGASFFHSLDWLECYWKHFAAGQRLRVLVVTEDRQPVGIVPLVVRTESTRVGRLRMLTYPLHDWATFFGPIGPNPSATLVAGLRHVRQTPRDWDVLDLRWVDADGADLGRTERAMAQTGFRPCGQKWDRTSLVELPENWPAYWQGREAKFRKNIDRLQRRMAEQGKVELVRYRPDGRLCGGRSRSALGPL